MYIKRLSEIFVQKAFLIFEILSFEVYCRSDRLPDSMIRGVGDSPYQRYAESFFARNSDRRQTMHKSMNNYI